MIKVTLKVLVLICFVSFPIISIYGEQPSFANHGNSEFVMLVKTDNPGTSSNLQFTVPTNGTDFNFNVDCDDDGTLDFENVTSSVTCNFSEPGEHKVVISGTYPRIHFFWDSDREKVLEVQQWGTNQWETMEGAFQYVTNLQVTATDTPDLSQVENMGAMFYGATSFNSSIDNWDTSNVTAMYGMFYGASSFNQPLNNWNTSNVTNMNGMFYGASSFNQPLNDWNTSNVASMGGMFYAASSLNQSIATWNVGSLTYADDMFGSSSLSTENYESLLEGWSSQDVHENVPLGGPSSGYCNSTYRDILVTVKHWTINDGGLGICFNGNVATGINTSSTPNSAITNIVLSGDTSELLAAGVEYGETTSYGMTSERSYDLNPGTKWFTLEGLQCSTTYQYRGFATSANGTDFGNNLSFSTVDCPTAPWIEPTGGYIASNYIGYNINVRHAGSSELTQVGIEYGLTNEYGNVAFTDAPSLGNNLIVINELQCESTYYLRGVASNQTETSYSYSVSITTSLCPDPTNISNVQSQSGNFNSSNISWQISQSFYTIVESTGVEYGLTEEYGQYASGLWPGNTNHYAQLNDLNCAQTYHYRIVVVSNAGTTYSDDQTFTTSDCPQLAILSENYSKSISRDYAGINFTVTNDGGDPNLTFGLEYGLTSAYGETFSSSVYGAGTFDASLYGLQCGTTYHFRTYVRNSAGTTYGNDETFTTSECLGIADLSIGLKLQNVVPVVSGDTVKYSVSIKNNGPGKFLMSSKDGLEIYFVTPKNSVFQSISIDSTANFNLECFNFGLAKDYDQIFENYDGDFIACGIFNDDDQYLENGQKISLTIELQASSAFVQQVDEMHSILFSDLEQDSDMVTIFQELEAGSEFFSIDVNNIFNLPYSISTTQQLDSENIVGHFATVKNNSKKIKPNLQVVATGNLSKNLQEISSIAKVFSAKEEANKKNITHAKLSGFSKSISATNRNFDIGSVSIILASLIIFFFIRRRRNIVKLKF